RHHRPRAAIAHVRHRDAPTFGLPLRLRGNQDGCGMVDRHADIKPGGDLGQRQWWSGDTEKFEQAIGLEFGDAQILRRFQAAIWYELAPLPQDPTCINVDQSHHTLPLTTPFVLPPSLPARWAAIAASWPAPASPRSPSPCRRLPCGSGGQASCTSTPPA